MRNESRFISAAGNSRSRISGEARSASARAVRPVRTDVAPLFKIFLSVAKSCETVTKTNKKIFALLLQVYKQYFSVIITYRKNTVDVHLMQLVVQIVFHMQSRCNLIHYDPKLTVQWKKFIYLKIKTRKQPAKRQSLIESFLPAAIIKINSTIHKPISTFILSRVHITRRYSLL